MNSVLKIQQQTKEIGKAQLILIKSLEEYQNTGNNNQLKKIIEDSKQNQEKINRLQNEQVNIEIEREELLNNKKEFDMVLKDLKQNHSLEVAELRQIIDQLKIESSIKMDNLLKKLNDKNNEYEKKIQSFKELQKKVIMLGKLVANKNKEQKEIMQMHQNFIGEAKNIENNQILLRNEQSQIESYKNLECEQIQKKEDIAYQNQEKLQKKLQEQQKMKEKNMDKIPKNNILIEKAKKKEEEKQKEKLLIKRKGSLKSQMSKNEPKRQYIDKIKDFIEVQNNVDILTINLECEQWDDEINYENAQYIKARIKKLKNLIEFNLNLKCNQISIKGAQYIGEGIKELKKLSKLNLNLGYNDIYTEGAQQIGEGIKALKNLKQLNLDLEYNQISVKGGEYIGEGILELKKLTELNLNLGYNKISALGAQYICAGIKELKNLRQLNLYLGYNDITVQGAQYISNGIKDLKKLTELNLDLGVNYICDQGAQYIEEGIKDLKNLKELNLDLSFNEISYEQENQIRNNLEKQIKGKTNIYL